MAKLVQTAPKYSIKDRPLWWLVSWNKVIDTETNEVYYRAEGLSKFFARLIYKNDKYYEEIY